MDFPQKNHPFLGVSRYPEAKARDLWNANEDVLDRSWTERPRPGDQFGDREIDPTSTQGGQETPEFLVSEIGDINTTMNVGQCWEKLS